MLVVNEETKEYGINYINKFFDILPETLNNKEHLISFYEKLSQEDSFNILIRNGKYFFDFKNK